MRTRQASRAVTITLAVVCYCTASPVRAESEELRVVLRSATVFVSASEGEGEGDEAPEGFDVRLLDMFVSWYGRRAGEDVTYRTATVRTVPELLDRARAGACDIAIGAITITDERDRTVDFSTPYLPLKSVVISRRGTFPDGPLEQLLEGRRVGVIVGSTHQTLGEELAARVPGMELETRYDSPADLFDELAKPSPEIDAAITDITHYWTLSPDKDIALVDTIGPAQGLGFVIPEGSPLKPVLDEFLAELRHSLTYFSLVERYFGNEAAEMVRSSRSSHSH